MVKGFNTAAVNYINEIKANHEQQINLLKLQLKTQHEVNERQIHKLKNEVIHFENKYLEIKERYDLLIYKRFMRSAEQIPADEKQKLLFTPEAEPVEEESSECEKEEKTEAIHFENKYLEIKEKYDLLIYKRFMRSAEQIPKDEKQSLLFTPEAEPVETEPGESEDSEEEKTEVKSHTRNKPGRKAINPNIPRVEKILDIPEDEKKCACGTYLTRIGEETNEKLHIEAPRIYVVKTIRPKYACRFCEGTEEEDAQLRSKSAVKIAPVEPAIIPRSIVSASLLATIFTHKFEDHLPYYRQEKQFGRIGVEISRQDMSA